MFCFHQNIIHVKKIENEFSEMFQFASYSLLHHIVAQHTANLYWITVRVNRHLNSAGINVTHVWSWQANGSAYKKVVQNVIFCYCTLYIWYNSYILYLFLKAIQLCVSLALRVHRCCLSYACITICMGFSRAKMNLPVLYILADQ